MSALAGIYDAAASRADIEHDLERMHHVLELPSLPSRPATTSAAGAGCVVLDHRTGGAPWTAHEPGRGLWLMCVGDLLARDELRARLGGAAESADSDAQLCLRLYLRDGDDFVGQLNGHFTIVLYREAERHLSLATDPFGYRPLFLAACGRRVLFASEMKAILTALQSTPAVDGIGLLQLMRQGWPLGERTWLEPIQAVAGGTWYDITPHAIRWRRYYRFRFRRGTASLSAYLEGFAHSMRRAMQRMTAGSERIGIALSGGLDSRSLLLATDRCATQPALAYTFGRTESRDVRYAAQLARLAGVAHLHLRYEAGYLGRVLVPVVWRTEGLLPFSEATFSSIHFHARLAQRVDAVLYGHAGDALTGAHLPQRVLGWRSRQRLIERLFRESNRVPEVLLQRIFHRGFYRRFAPDLFAAARAAFTDIDQDEIADVLDVWDIENRQRRGTFASAAVERYRFGVRAPFLDRDLVDHLRQAPPIWRLQQLAYKQMIVTAFPHAAAVPWAYTGSQLRTRRSADFAALAAGYIDRRLRRAWGAAAPQAFRDLGADTRGDRRLARTICDFAASSSFPGDVLDRRGIEDVVHRHWDGGEDLTHLVSMLATVAAAYRLLLWQQPRAIPAEALPPA